MDIFLEAFAQRALIGGVLIGLMAPLMGVFLVLRRLSMIGDTLAHISVAGLALGFLVGLYPVGVGLVFTLLAAFAVEKLRKAYKTYAELSIAILMSGGIALATMLFTMGIGLNKVNSYLFGSIYTLSSTDLWVVFGVTVVVVALVTINYKELFLLFFDEDAAAVGGLPIPFYNLMMTMLTALVISAAIKIVGALLVSSLLTIPVACSLLVAKSFKHSVGLAVLFAEIAVLAGLSIAAMQNLAPGATIVLLLIAMLIVLLALKKGFKL